MVIRTFSFIISTMDARFLPDNRHWDDAQGFDKLDPQLRHLKSLHFVYKSPLIQRLPQNKPGIYSLVGSYNVGKTTLLKIWISTLLEVGTDSKSIIYLAGNLIKEAVELSQILNDFISKIREDQRSFILIDDVTDISGWLKAIQAFSEQNQKSVNCTLLLASSYNFIYSQLKSLFPNANKSFHLLPLSFKEVVSLKETKEPTLDSLYSEFNFYLQHGGYLQVINEMASEGFISDKTLNSFAEWIAKEFVKQGKHKRYLHEILNASIKHYDEQITWNFLAEELTIEHPKTIGDYFLLLEELDIVFIQHALLEKTLSPAPKKKKKVFFTDPFIYHSIRAWLTPVKNYYESQVQFFLENNELASKLVSACVVMQFQRFYPTYYIKSKGEVDLAYVHDNQFWPIEISWMSQMRAKDLKQILTYANGRILTKTNRSGIIEHIRTEPLPLALWQL